MSDKELNDERIKLLNLRHFPARLSRTDVAIILNCQKHDIYPLMLAGLLKPIGNPPVNGKKYFETKAVLAAASDSKWLVKMTTAIHRTWQARNEQHEALVDERENSDLAA
jgi:hypothetical protein